MPRPEKSIEQSIPSGAAELLEQMLTAAQSAGERFLDVKAGDLQRAIGTSPGANGTNGGSGEQAKSAALAACCKSMRSAMNLPHDVQLSPPHSGNTTTLLIRYALPRRVAKVLSARAG